MILHYLGVFLMSNSNLPTNPKLYNLFPAHLSELVPSCSFPPKTSEHIPYTDKAEVEGSIFFCEFCELRQTDEYIIGENVCQCATASDLSEFDWSIQS